MVGIRQNDMLNFNLLKSWSWLYILAILGLAVMVIVSYIFNIPLSSFTRDQSVVLNGKPYHGLLSSIGILFWSWTAASSFFYYALLRKGGDESEFSKFVLIGGVLTLLLLLDDFFMFHEWMLPGFGINEKIVLLSYVVFALVYLVKFKQIILQRDYSLLLIALSFFIFSMIEDILKFSPHAWHYLFEDGTKFLGIISWFCYHVSLYYKESSFTIHEKINRN